LSVYVAKVVITDSSPYTVEVDLKTSSIRWSAITSKSHLHYTHSVDNTVQLKTSSAAKKSRMCMFKKTYKTRRTRSSAIAVETALHGGLVMAKRRRLELGDNILRTL